MSSACVEAAIIIVQGGGRGGETGRAEEMQATELSVDDGGALLRLDKTRRRPEAGRR